MKRKPDRTPPPTPPSTPGVPDDELFKGVILLGMAIGGMVGAGVGSLLGVEVQLGVIGVVVGAVWAMAARHRFDKAIRRGQRKRKRH